MKTTLMTALFCIAIGNSQAAGAGQAPLMLTGHTAQLMSVAFSADGKRLASASYDHTVKVWDATSGQETLSLKGHPKGS